MRDTVHYNPGIAWRISAETPLSYDLDSLRRLLADLGLALLDRAAPDDLEREARKALATATGGELLVWCRRVLLLMQSEYRARLGYLDDAVAELDTRGPCSSIATHAVVRLGERLVLESQLRADNLERLEEDLAFGELDVAEAVAEAAVAAGRRLDVPSAEVVSAMSRVLARGDPGPYCETAKRAVDRASDALATGERRAAVRDWAAELADELDGRLPLLVAALRQAIETSSVQRPREDHLWRGATRGLILQHEAWRLDGPHLNELHAVLGPL